MTAKPSLKKKTARSSSMTRNQVRKPTNNNPRREEMITVSKSLWDAMNKRMADEEMLRLVMKEQISTYEHYYRGKIEKIIEGMEDLKNDMDANSQLYADEINGYEVGHDVVPF